MSGCPRRQGWSVTRLQGRQSGDLPLRTRRLARLVPPGFGSDIIVPVMEERQRIDTLIERLATAYPDATCALDHRSPFELLVATILSAQCTDARVNMVTPALFAKYLRPEDYLAVPPEELEQDIHSTGFFRNK